MSTKRLVGSGRLPQRSHTDDKAVLSDLAPARDGFRPPHERSHLAPPHGWSGTPLGQLQRVRLGRALAQTPFPRRPRATQPRLHVLHTRRSDLERIRPDLSSAQLPEAVSCHGLARHRDGRPRQGRMQVLTPPLAARIYTVGSPATDT